MGLSISEEELKVVQSGTALRFTVSVYAGENKDIGQWQKGYMAFRQEDGTLDVKPPVMKLNLRGKRINYYASGITPDAVVAIKKYLEETWGEKIQANPDWNDERADKRKRQSEEGWS